ncbi:MAG: ABC transporter ATP-binding protein [Deltaproteobacteria bacterium]|nr:ABC transporter ATP-binding protein [Deltaproteobacteria bacterium]
MIRFEGISKSFGENLILSDIDLSIARGEFVTMIGLSGSGKTTLLKLINALLAPDKGWIFVDGEDLALADKIELRRRIGYVIQSVGLFPHMSVRGNVEYVPKLYPKSKRPATIIAPEELMDIVHLERELLGRFPSELSGGQMQRVGIARALAVRPKIMLMDEPFGSVDQITRKQLQASILEIQRELGVTIVFVTHDIDEALKLGNKVIVLNDRRVARFASPDELRANPGSEFVRRLVFKE